MAINVWTPFQELDRLQREVNRLFDNSAPRQQSTEGRDFAQWQPSVDVYEDAERFVVRAELPGLKAQDVNVSVENNLLTLSGARKLEHEEKKNNYLRIERFYGTFRRSFQLPTTIDASKIGAEMKDGLLTVSLPKRVEVQPKQIKVEVK
jgi:HSP20 family protein